MFANYGPPFVVDDVDREIIAANVAALDEREGVRVGDFVVFADGVTRRASHIWKWDADEEGPAIFSVQTSDGGSWYLGEGYVSMSGSLYTGIPGDSLTLTDETREGDIWIFHHGWAAAHRGVHFKISFRVFTTPLRSDETR